MKNKREGERQAGGDSAEYWEHCHIFHTNFISYVYIWMDG